MVKLTPQQQLDVPEVQWVNPPIPRPPRNHHLWGSRFGTQREAMKARLTPTTQQQLENMAQRMVNIVELHVPKSDEHYPMIMLLLRMEHNLTFAMVGDNCPGAYDPDVLDAPER